MKQRYNNGSAKVADHKHFTARWEMLQAELRIILDDAYTAHIKVQADFTAAIARAKMRLDDLANLAPK